MMKTLGVMFAGGDLFGIGAKEAGYEEIWGIEWDDRIAAVARQNGFPVITGDVTAMLPQGTKKMKIMNDETGVSTKLHCPDHLHASPPCPNFSVAKTNNQETEFDIAVAKSVSVAISHFQPKTFSLENVPAYVHSQSFRSIINTLHDLGYFVDYQNLNSANFGVPQTRNRLWVRASKKLMSLYPEPTKWVGWYDAIEDLIPSLPETEFAPWQIARLPKEYKDFIIGQGTYSEAIERHQPIQTIPANNNQSAIKAFIMSSGNNSFADAVEGGGVPYAAEPVMTMMAGKTESKIKAFVLDGGNSGKIPITCRDGENPIFTIPASTEKSPVRAFVVDGSTNANGKSVTVPDGDAPIFTQLQSGSKKPARAFVGGHVVKMNIKALGRFQTVPDWYQGLTVRINGNGVPCKQATSVLQTLG